MASKDLSDSYINYDEFVYVNNVLRNYTEIEKEIKNLKNAGEYTKQKQWKRIPLNVKKTNDGLRQNTLMLV